jgi:hypothetical protein
MAYSPGYSDWFRDVLITESEPRRYAVTFTGSYERKTCFSLLYLNQKTYPWNLLAVFGDHEKVPPNETYMKTQNLH